MAKSEYLQREEAAKKQLGAKGVKKRVKQLPTAARASLREMTGIDVSRKGVSVDPGNVALAAAGFIPFGKSISVGAKIAKMVVPKATRVARAASRTVGRAASNVGAAQTRAAAGRSMQEAAAAANTSAKYALARAGQSKSVRLGLDFANPVGNKPHQSYNYAIKDVTNRVNPETITSANRAIDSARSMKLAGANAEYYAQQAARRSQRVVDAGTAQAAAEIKRRLAVLQRANRNR